MINHIVAFFLGIAAGIPMSFALGPVFFALIQNSLSNSFKSAFYIATGVIIADIILFVAAYSGTQLFIEGQNTDTGSMNFWVELVGGSILILMGFFTIRKQVTESNQIKFFYNPFMFFMRGFALNIFNPLNFFLWVGLIAVYNLQHDSTSIRFTFYIATLLSIFMTEILIAYFAARITKLLNARVLHIISIVNGLIFTGCGILLFVSAFIKF